MSWFVGAAAGFVLAVVLHAAAVRLPLPGTSVLKFLGLGSLVGTVWIVLSVMRLGWSAEWLAAVLAYAFACELYVFLFTLVGNSVSVSVLLAIDDGCRTQREIALRYRCDVMVSRRLGQLERARLIDREGERVQILEAGRRLIVRFDGIGQTIRPGVDVEAR